MNSYAEEPSWVLVEAIRRRARALLAHGLRGTNLVRCWVGWHIQPLSIRIQLFHEYYEDTGDDMRYSIVTLNEDQLVKNAKKLLGKTKSTIAMTRRAPFISKNLPPTL